MGSPRFRRHLICFRRFCDGSLALAFPHLACRDHVSTFLQRSLPSLLTTAACSGLEPAPDRRPRGALPHLSYSCASPCGPAMLVTHSHKQTSASPRSVMRSPSPTTSANRGIASEFAGSLAVQTKRAH